MKATLEPIVAAELTKLGYELVEFRLTGSHGRPVLDIRMDRLDGQQVQVGDCAAASRAIEARLDTEPGLITSRYVLEVSSPGIERPLRNATDWRRAIGKKASVNSPALHGRIEVEVLALTGESGQEVLQLKDKKGAEHAVRLTEVTDARTVFDWK